MDKPTQHFSRTDQKKNQKQPKNQEREQIWREETPFHQGSSSTQKEQKPDSVVRSEEEEKD